jgi:hypothetical protein
MTSSRYPMIHLEKYPPTVLEAGVFAQSDKPDRNGRSANESYSPVLPSVPFAFLPLRCLDRPSQRTL